MSIQNMIEKRQCLALMGPTASGKSQLSMDLAAKYPIEIISVDSALIYRDMDIGTAKPSAEELAAVPHHLIDTHDAAESYSASEFVEDVHRLVEEIFARNRLPVLVGGTMMYFNALQQGMSDLPSADESVRAKLQAQWESEPEALHERLQMVDPVSAERIHPNDPQRLIRALEVYEVSGKTLTELRAQPKSNLPKFDLLKVALIPEDRVRLHKQIAIRFQSMLESGFLQEVKALMSRSDLNPEMTSIRSVGYRQAWSFLSGEYDYETFVEKGLVATRQLAKRQLTWLRKEEGLIVLDPFEVSREDRLQVVVKLIESA
ncbi:tRNA (adenosine(37)-N6)-dimethylallyltransferase MiaA [Thiomicrorhabdus sp. ZW0627]|uniref:tRNA (adenosine(37)-N6)-dimethylallyltransferase MiaA n=1 Tax=Thiomicrorhabdus sp. ZW0627 TaxID=3039774 RepID=UPI002436B94D|nr:tRNA (adenosine(37)-N6)-dimethylallyltransferase MiaA [Thiomicrorhabdus sp. ZW0627]MDG6773127.1 tRNA (adenosine(37)-N6)-dimethylallyltransferase MiaA [Thiomicrorhabdus sp. ZW0627]